MRNKKNQKMQLKNITAFPAANIVYNKKRIGYLLVLIMLNHRASADIRLAFYIPPSFDYLTHHEGFYP